MPSEGYKGINIYEETYHTIKKLADDKDITIARVVKMAVDKLEKERWLK